MVGLAYYEQQMKRLSLNKDPKATTNAWGPLINTITHYGLNSLKKGEIKFDDLK